MGRPAVRVTVDTNVLVRAVILDDPVQSPIAVRCLREAEAVAVPTTVLCEYVWVLRAAYKRPRSDIAASIRTLLEAGNVHLDRQAVEQGLTMFDAGGDFADGAIAVEGRRLGGDELVTFDHQAAALLPQAGLAARCLDD